MGKRLLPCKPISFRTTNDRGMYALKIFYKQNRGRFRPRFCLCSHYKEKGETQRQQPQLQGGVSKADNVPFL